MADDPPKPRSSAAAEDMLPPQPKRRKIRKGTQSCWECKRRKTRCTFAAPTESTCDGCRSRHTKCIGQEFPDEPPSPSPGRKGRDNERLSRVESLVEELVNRRTSSSRKPDNTSGPDLVLDATESLVANAEPLNQRNLDKLYVDGLHDGTEPSSLDDIAQALLAVWPSEKDLNLILSIPVCLSALLHGVVCKPYADFFSGKNTCPKTMLRLPPPGSHPVLIARRLLMLGTLLQAIPSSSADRLSGMSVDYRTLMSRVVNTAARLVTRNDELTGSLEGIECVMMESMYLNNVGYLRYAWLTNRRAMTVAQMMGIHTGAVIESNSRLSSMMLDAETRDRIDPDFMWARLVITDRYLSLMLGLPQGTSENAFARPEALQKCTPMERMERMMTVAAGHILQRNNTQQPDPAAMHKVDKMLQDAAALMPPQWWLTTPNTAVLSKSKSNSDMSDDADVNADQDAFHETLRLMNQLAYRHLLVQLHLPYMLLSDPQYDYSTMTAASTSRAIVSQFVAFRSCDLGPAYCRGVDFVAFVASTTLCLAHIDARRQKRNDKGTVLGVFQSHQHERLADRALLERTLEIMEKASDDVIARKISSILGPLLDIENNSAGGLYYETSASPVERGKNLGFQTLENTVDTVTAASILRIQIPYFGTIKIEYSPPRPHAGCIEPTQASFTGGIRSPNSDSMTSTGPRLNLGFNTTQATNIDSQIIPSCLHPSEPSGPAMWDPSLLSVGDSGDIQEANSFLVPGLHADVDDWVLQGVDMALFNNLTHGWADATDMPSQPADT